MALNQWFKFYGGEFLSDPKIASLSAQERSCWITLLALASISSTPGVIEYLTVEVLLEKSGIAWDPYNPEQWDKALSVMEKFVRMKMITKSDEGVLEILNWKKRQETALTNAERQAKYRESNEKVTKPVTKVTLDKIREDKNTSATRIELVSSSEESEKRPARAPKYPHAKEVSKWFPKPEPSWLINTTELKHMELLYERGEDKVKSILKFIAKYKDSDYFPSVTKPSDVERKWEDIKNWADKNGV